jgi:hypothetical protein
MGKDTYYKINRESILLRSKMKRINQTPQEREKKLKYQREYYRKNKDKVKQNKWKNYEFKMEIKKGNFILTFD